MPLGVQEHRTRAIDDKVRLRTESYEACFVVYCAWAA